MAVNGGATGGRRQRGEVGRLASLAGASSCKWALVGEEAMAVQTLGTDVNGERRSVVALVSRGDGRGESEQSGKRAQGGGEKVEGSPLHPCVRIRPPRHRVGDDRR
jgi:hypothetical protein